MENYTCDQILRNNVLNSQTYFMANLLVGIVMSLKENIQNCMDPQRPSE